MESPRRVQQPRLRPVPPLLTVPALAVVKGAVVHSLADCAAAGPARRAPADADELLGCDVLDLTQEPVGVAVLAPGGILPVVGAVLGDGERLLRAVRRDLLADQEGVVGEDAVGVAGRWCLVGRHG